MHPIERLRYVARASGADQRVLVRETASALRGLRLEPSGLVTACRRIVERHPTSGPLWWLCARVLTAPEPFAETLAAADEIEGDPTPDHLVGLLPDEATVTVIGWPDLAGEALVRRGDPYVLSVDAHGEGVSYVRRLQRADVEAEVISLTGLAAAVTTSDLVLIEAVATGPGGALCVAGSRAAAAVAYCAEIPVWLVAGVGRRLPEPLWAQLVGRAAEGRDPWELEDEVVPLGLVSHVVGPDGLAEGIEGLLTAECPMAPELLRGIPF
jgi:hypothetical protein